MMLQVQGQQIAFYLNQYTSTVCLQDIYRNY